MNLAIAVNVEKTRSIFVIPRVEQSRLEAIQWLAFAFMVVDHLGAFVFQNELWMRAIGRLAFPLFAMVFAWRLADSLERNEQKQLLPMARRLTVTGLVAHGLFMIITMSWYLPEVNIMFSFVAALVIISLCMEHRPFLGLPWVARLALAAAILQYASSRVDYNGWGILMMLGLFSYFRWGGIEALVSAVAMLAMLTYKNDVHLAILAFPIGVALIKIPGQILQAKKPYPLLFYWLYPTHLFVILVVAIGLAIKTQN